MHRDEQVEYIGRDSDVDRIRQIVDIIAEGVLDHLREIGVVEPDGSATDGQERR